jgi:DNA-binding MltR family transcriptional regulator
MTRYTPKDITAILASIEGDNDRSVALVGASLIEYTLEEAIRARIRPFDPEDDKADFERLFGINGVFAGLSGKIISAYALKIFGPAVRRDLELINKIRNEFAHDMNPLGFSDEHIKSRCRELQTPKETTYRKMDIPRGMYLATISLLTGVIGLRNAFDLAPTLKDAPDVDEAVTKLFSYWLDK